MRGPHELLKAALPPPTHMHRQAAPMLLESLALWFHQPLSVVLVADGEGTSSGLGICNRHGIGEQTLHYRVEVVEPGDRRGLRMHGIGDFSRVRRVALGGRP